MKKPGIKTTLKKVYKDIERINKLKHESVALVLCKLFEESGELAQAVNVKLGIKKGIPAKVRANVTEEVADSMQCILSLAALFGIGIDEILAEITKKNVKWESQPLKVKPQSMKFDVFKKQFDKSFAKVSPEDFVADMERLGYKFEDAPVKKKKAVKKSK